MRHRAQEKCTHHTCVSWAALCQDEKEKIIRAKPTSSIICNAFGQMEASFNPNHVCLALKPVLSVLSHPVCHRTCPGFSISLTFTAESFLHQQHHQGQCSLSGAGKQWDLQASSARASNSAGSLPGCRVRLLQGLVQLGFFLIPN